MRPTLTPPHSPPQGFTLIEMIVVLTLTGIIAILVARNITRPVEGFIDLSQRSELVDSAELALRRMSREIRLALPNSVRLSAGSPCSAPGGTAVCAVEILRTLDGGRYRDLPDGTAGPCGTPGDDKISFAKATDCFEILGSLNNTPQDGGASQADCMTGVADCLVIFNTGQDGANAYLGQNIAAIQSSDVDGNSIVDSLVFTGAPPFPFRSPRQRFHVVDMPVSYVCNPGAGTITRQADYTIAAAQLTNPNPPGDILVENVSSCNFIYAQGTNSRNGLLTIDITLTKTDTQGNPNSVRLVEQIQVPNIP